MLLIWIKPFRFIIKTYIVMVYLLIIPFFSIFKTIGYDEPHNGFLWNKITFKNGTSLANPWLNYNHHHFPLHQLELFRRWTIVCLQTGNIFKIRHEFNASLLTNLMLSILHCMTIVIKSGIKQTQHSYCAKYFLRFKDHFELNKNYVRLTI